MNFLDLPEVQTALIPFTVAGVAATALRAVNPGYFGLGAITGFYAATVAMGVFNLAPTRSSNRILLLGILFLVAGLALDWIWSKRKMSTNTKPIAYTGIVSLLSATAITWLLWNTIIRKSGVDMVMTLSAAIAYALWISATLASLKDDALRGLSATCFLALATGVIATLGSSALLGQMGIGLGVACGALLMISTFNQDLKLTFGFFLPISVLVAAIAVSGVVFAKVPWAALLVLSLVPVAVRIPVPENWPRFGQSVLISFYAAVVGIAASLLAWWLNAQSSSYY